MVRHNGLWRLGLPLKFYHTFKLRINILLAQQQGLKLTFKKSTHLTSTKSKSAKGRPIVFYIVHLLCNVFLYYYGIFYIATPTKSRDNEEPEKVTDYLTVFTLS